MKKLLRILLPAILLATASCSRTSNETTLVASRISPQTRLPVIVLDAGHGGEDHGAKAHGITEKDGTLQATMLTKKHLNALGYRVVLTRDRDQHISLHHRSSIANRYKDGIFVSIHLNSAPSKAASGIEVFWCDKSKAKEKHHSENLASNVLSHLIHHTSANSRGVKKGRFHVIRETKIPSVLVEAGFITNLEESERLKRSDYINSLSLGIANGIHNFLNSSFRN